jgi:hypothetical protein
MAKSTQPKTTKKRKPGQPTKKQMAKGGRKSKPGTRRGKSQPR